MKDVVKEAVELHKTFPDVVAGFDMVRIKLLITAKKMYLQLQQKILVKVVGCHLQVGREDSGRTLWFYRDALSLPEELGSTLPFYFHAGETGIEN